MVIFLHSLEHLPDPPGVPKHAASLLSSGAILIVRMSLVSSYAWARYGVQFDALRHAFLHSRARMTCLARSARLSIQGVGYHPTDFHFLGSELYARDIPLTSFRADAPNPGRAIFSAEPVEALRRHAADLNATDRDDHAASCLRRM